MLTFNKFTNCGRARYVAKRNAIANGHWFAWLNHWQLDKVRALWAAAAAALAASAAASAAAAAIAAAVCWLLLRLPPISSGNERLPCGIINLAALRIASCRRF